ncbi:CsbD family protein [Streptomyces sp. NPDC005181]|uniref:CsbD family protein n=1 Tax=Streptomyces sp. NPDC005181 TaxID=3156869 RepID=UPI0033B0258B
MSSGSAKDKAKGKAKEAMGKMTGDQSLKAEGKTDQAKGKAKGAAHHARESAKGVKDSLKRD